MSAYEPFPAGESANEPVRDDERLASRWRRFWALLFDNVLLIVVAVTIGVVFALATGADEDSDSLVAVLYGVYATLLLFYYPLTLSRGGARNGQTFGKQLLKVRVVTVEGVPVGFWRGVRRDVLGTTLIGFVSGGLYTLVDCPWALFDSRRQALHDKIGSTYVFRADAPREQASQWPGTTTPPPPPTPQQRWDPPVPPPSSNDDMNRVFGR